MLDLRLSETPDATVPLAPDPGRRRRFPSWAATAGTGAALTALLVAVGWVVLDGIARYPAFSDDEGTYVAEAWAVRHLGMLSHYTYWYDHPPLGWFQLAGLVGVLDAVAPALAGPAVVAARYVMVPLAVLSAGLVYVIARRLDLRRPLALGALALYGLSPLAAPMLRQVYLDNVALPWMLGAMALALDRRSRLWASAAAGGCAAVSVLSKETMLLVVPAVALAAWVRSDPRTRAFTLTALGSAFLLLLLGYPLFAALKGELFPGPGHVSLLEAVRFQLFGRASTGSALLDGTRSHSMLLGWLQADPLLVGGGCLIAPTACLDRTLRPVAVAVLVLVAVAARPGYLPTPYVVALLPWCALLIAAAGQRALPWIRPALADARSDATSTVRAAAAVAVCAVLAAGLTVAVTRRAQDVASLATQDATASSLAASRWMATHVDPRARVLADDTYFVDLARAGFEPGLGVVWFYKLDFATNLDPSVVARLPAGYRSFDYVVSSPVLRAALDTSPGQLGQVRAALEASRPVASFGQGKDLVEVRRLVGPGTGSGRIPRDRG